MLHRYTNHFMEYSGIENFAIHSIQPLTARLNKFKNFLKIQKIRSIQKVRYRHLTNFTADYNTPSIHASKSRAYVASINK